MRTPSSNNRKSTPTLRKVTPNNRKSTSDKRKPAPPILTPSRGKDILASVPFSSSPHAAGWNASFLSRKSISRTPIYIMYMTLSELLEYRRAVRDYDPMKTIDADKVQACIRLATLAPTSSNMQLWEAYHVTSPAVLQELGVACLGQNAATTCRQMVVFVTRQDRWKAHAAAVLKAAVDDINRNSPAERRAHRIKEQTQYYTRLMPLLYKRCFGLLGTFRKALTGIIGLTRPITREVSEADTRVVVHKSCALAVQTFMLAMSEQGYDTCPLEGFDSHRVKKALRLPSACGINMILTCGIRTPKGVHGERFRLPFEEYYHRV